MASFVSRWQLKIPKLFALPQSRWKLRQNVTSWSCGSVLSIVKFLLNNALSLWNGFQLRKKRRSYWPAPNLLICLATVQPWRDFRSSFSSSGVRWCKSIISWIVTKNRMWVLQAGRWSRNVSLSCDLGHRILLVGQGSFGLMVFESLTASPV